MLGVGLMLFCLRGLTDVRRWNGKVLAATGRPGTALGEFGEAHFLAVSPRNELFVADSVNGALVKFVKK